MPFTVIPPAPSITSFSPTSGSAGEAIAISGSNFTGATSVQFNGVNAAQFTVQSATQISAIVPIGCSSGLITVKTPGGIAYSATGFTVAATGAIALSVQDEGNTITTQATAINFVGAGVIASNTGGVITVTIPGGGGTSGGGSSAYPQQILNSSPYVYLRLNESSGTVAVDSSINHRDGTYSGSFILGVPGSLSNDPDTAVRFNGGSISFPGGEISSPPIFTLECRFKTTNYGGLFGFGGSGGYDRDLFVRSDGKLSFFIYAYTSLVSPLPYNDGAWHTVSAVLHSGGTELWADGNLVASNTTSGSYIYSGKWTVGRGGYGGDFIGTIDEASINHARISQSEIQTRHQMAAL